MDSKTTIPVPVDPEAARRGARERLRLRQARRGQCRYSYIPGWDETPTRPLGRLLAQNPADDEPTGPTIEGEGT